MGCNCSLAVLMILYEDGFITAVFRVCGGTNSQKIDESAEDLQNIWCTAVELEYEGSSSRIWKCCAVFYDVLHLVGSNCVELMDSLGSGQIGEMGGNYSLSSFPSLPTRPLWEQRASTLELKLSTRSSTERGVCVCVCVRVEVEVEAWMNAWPVFFHDFKENTGFAHKEQNHSPQALERNKK